MLQINNLPIKVHRVASLEEIQVLEKLGVEYIGLHVDDDAFFNIDPDPLWKDDRYLMEEQIQEFFPHIKQARGFVEYSYDLLSAEVCSKLSDYGVKLMQTSAQRQVHSSVISSCEQKGIKIIYDQLYIVPEDDPRFFNITKLDWPLLSFFDLQIFPSQKDAWDFLRNRSLHYSRDVITMEDIKALANRYPLFASVNATVENINEIIRDLKSIGIAGLSFTLSSSKIGSYHTFEFEELVRILQTIRK